MWAELLDKAAQFIYYGLVGAFGGVAAYVYRLATGVGTFQFWLFIANVFLAFFVGKMVSTWLPDMERLPEYRDGLVMAAGFTTYPILQVVEARFGKWIVDRFLPEEK